MSAISIVSIIIYLTIYFKINEDRYVQCFKITYWEVIIHILLYGLMIGGGTRSSGFCIVLLVRIRVACYFYKRVKNRVLRSSKYLICASAFYIIFSITIGNYTPLYDSNNTIILCDIDDFKNVNDKYGHECGDMILEKIANIIQKLVEGIGYAARWGGEEILILSENKYIDAYVLGEQIRKKIEDAAFSYEGEVIFITITIGIGEVKDFLTREAILIADKNLYIGKRNGKNIVIK